MKNTFKCIAFDFDGTIADSKDIFLNIFNLLAQKHEFKPLTQQNLMQIRKLSVKERLTYLDIPMYKLPLLSAKFLQLYNESAGEIKIIAGMRDVLYDLHRNGYQLAIISSNSRKNVEQFLQNNRIDCISYLHCSSSIFGKDKVIRKFLKTYKFSSEQVIYVGDERRDIEASNKNNIQIIWVNWGYDDKNSISDYPPDFIASKPPEISEIIHSAY